MTTKLVVFGEYLGYRHGGAEKSMHSLLSCFKNVDIEIISPYDITHEPDNIECEHIAINRVKMVHLNQFQYIKYFINSIIYRISTKRLLSDLLFAQGMEAPMAINHAKTKTVYFIRNERNLNIYRCYENNIYKIVKFIIRYIIELPFILFYFFENNRAIRKAGLVVSNSQYIREKVLKVFGRDSIVIYPSIEFYDYNEDGQDKIRKYIMMIGDDESKGIKTFVEIAKRMPNLNFMIVGRQYGNIALGNIIYRSYVNNHKELYGEAKILLVPSIWEEAFGRVSIEAQSFGVPSVVSRRGGLPETVASDEYIVDKYLDPAEWVKKINFVLNNYTAHSKKARSHSKEFSLDKQVSVFTTEIYKLTNIMISTFCHMR